MCAARGADGDALGGVIGSPRVPLAALLTSSGSSPLLNWFEEVLCDCTMFDLVERAYYRARVWGGGCPRAGFSPFVLLAGPHLGLLVWSVGCLLWYLHMTAAAGGT